MRRTLQGELIGCSVKVDGSQGIIVDESRNMLSVQHSDGKTRTWPKEGHTFTINGMDIEGKTLVGRPEERIKRNR